MSKCVHNRVYFLYGDDTGFFFFFNGMREAQIELSGKFGFTRQDIS